MGETCITRGREEKCVQNFNREPEGKRPLGRPRRRWEDRIIMDLRQVVRKCGLDQDRDQ